MTTGFAGILVGVEVVSRLKGKYPWVVFNVDITNPPPSIGR